MIARQLAALKVDVIEAGFAAASDGDFQAVSQIAKEVRGPVIASLARTMPDDIDRAWDAVAAAERARIHVFISTSPIHMERMMRMTPAEVMRAVQRKRRKGLRILRGRRVLASGRNPLRPRIRDRGLQGGRRGWSYHYQHP